MLMLSFIKSIDVLLNIANLFIALLIGLFFGLERSYRGKVHGLMTYSLVTVGFAAITIGIVYLQPVIDVLVIALLFLSLVLVVFLAHQWKKENMDDLSSASLLISGTLGILVSLKLYSLVITLFVFTLIIFTLVYLLNIYIEKRKYAITVIVEQEENILLRVLMLCDEIGAKINHLSSSIVLINGKEALRLEVTYKYGTSKEKVRKIFDLLKNEKIINIVYHGDIHKMEWR